MKERRWLLIAAAAVAAVQIGFLVSMIAGRAAVLRNGQEVVLAVAPVDPRDLLRGDYVTLTYNISRVPIDLLSAAPELVENSGADQQIVYVRLKPDSDGIFQPIAASLGERPKPAPDEGEVDIRGHTRSNLVRLREGRADQFMSVYYGIERFYVPEGEGRQIERDLRERKFQMKVAVGRDGTAQIRSFYDGETMLYAEPLY